MIRVAHFSDLHLLSLEGVRPWAFLGKRLTGGLNLLFNRGGEFPEEVAQALVTDLWEQHPDHVIVTGDVSNLAFKPEFAHVRTLLERIPLPAKEITVVPGNHDYYTLSSVQKNDFGRVLAPYIAGDSEFSPDSNLRANRIHTGFPFVRLRKSLAIIALSSAIPTMPLLANGKLGKEQIKKTEKILKSDTLNDRFRLVMLHHPPGGIDVKWHNRLTDKIDFAAMLKRVGAELVVHGHLHRYCRFGIAGPTGKIPVVGVASGTWLSPKDPLRRAQYHLYEIEGRSLVRIVRRKYDCDTGRFGSV